MMDAQPSYRNRDRLSWKYLAGVPACLLLALIVHACKDLGVTERSASTDAKDAVISIAIGDIPGFPTSLRIEDSLGRPTATLRAGEPFWLRYCALNQTGKSLTWGTGMGYPHARFLITMGADTLVDSFRGMAFIAIPLHGVVSNGDSLTALWRLDPAKHPLNPGTYSAVAVPMFVIGEAQMPDDDTADFSITP